LVATRAFISELTGDLLPVEMKDQMVSVATDREALERAILGLEESAQECADACLDFLAWAWDDAANREAIRQAFAGTAVKLPAIEVGLVALTAMYGMYLAATGGRRKETYTVRQKPDGTFEKTVVIEYAGVAEALSMVAKLFGIGSGNGKNSGA
jgi:hypothetical protein